MNEVINELPHRETEIQEILDFVFKSRKYNEEFAMPTGMANQLLIEGPSGTGKTSVINQIIPILQKEGFGVKYLIAQDTDVRTAYSLLSKTYYHGASYSSAQIDNEILLLGKYPVIILDELQTLVMNSLSYNLLYLLTRKQGLILIMISSKPNIKYLINDKSVQDSFLPRVIRFNPYTTAQKRDIIKYYDKNHILSDDDISFLLQLIGDTGSARPIVYVLSSLLMNFTSQKDIKEQILEAYNQYMEVEVDSTISALSPLAKQILFLLFSSGHDGMSAKELLSLYNSSFPSVNYYRFRQAIEELENKNILSWVVRGLGRKKGVAGNIELSISYFGNQQIKDKIMSFLSYAGKI